MTTVISVENIYKEYRLGVISKGTLLADIQSWWANIRGKEDPNSLISEHHNLSLDGKAILSLNNISFTVEKGDVIGIIGRNGAGKSTLLKILSRITSPTKGIIKIKGRIASLLEVGTGFHKELTGRENIYLNGAILGMKKAEIESKLGEIIDFSEIGKFIDTPVKRYSSGMSVRLAFSVAAHLDPEILIVDEVLAVGDLQFQKKCLEKMESVRESGRTVLFVSHNMNSVSTLCNKALVLDKGKIVCPVSPTNKAVNFYYEQISEMINTKLSTREDRKGLGGIKVMDMWLESKGEKTQSIHAGSRVKFIIHYKRFSHDRIGKGMNAIIFIHTLAKVHLAEFATQFTEQTFHDISDEGYIECIIEKFPFNLGKYIYHVELLSGSQVEDRLLYAGEFQVDTLNFYPSNYKTKSRGPLLVEQDWKIKQI